jgi:hypothetical protein
MQKSRIAVSAMLLLSASSLLAANRGDLIDGKFDATSRKERTEVAQSLQETVEKLSQYLPTPRPQDADWIEQEQAAIAQLGDSKPKDSRQLQFLNSPEFHHARLHNFLTNTLNALRCVIDDNSSLSREMMCWDVASILLTDASSINDSIKILLRAGRLPKTVLESGALGPMADESLGFGYWYDAYGRGIQEYLVIPYLKS